MSEKGLRWNRPQKAQPAWTILLTPMLPLIHTPEADAVGKDGDGSLSGWIRPEQRLNDPWELKRGFTVAFKLLSNQVTATPKIDGISEYGEGATRSKALEDLLTSFTDYREWLEEREERLHPRCSGGSGNVARIDSAQEAGCTLDNCNKHCVEN